MATSDTETRLLRVPLFGAMSKRQIGKVAKAAKEVTHPAGREVVEQDKGSLAFHLILSGEASVSQGEKHLRDLGPGDYFGEISMIDGRPRSATVTATSSLTTLALPHTAFQQLLDDEPEIARSLLIRLCERLREAESRTAQD